MNLPSTSAGSKYAVRRARSVTSGLDSAFRKSLYRLGIVLAWVNPTAGLLFIISSLREFTVDRQMLALGTVVGFLGFCIALHTGKLDVVLTVAALLIWTAASHKNRLAHLPKINFPLYYCFFGLLVGYLFNRDNDGRSGLFFEDPNFSGFTLIVLLIIVLERRRSFIPLLLLLFTGLFLTASRTLFAVALATIFFYLFRAKKLLSVSVYLLGLVLYVNAGLVFDAISGVIPSRSGAAVGIERLTILFDISSLERVGLNYAWSSAILADAGSTLLGLPAATFDHLLNNVIGIFPHNSFVQKTAEYGMLYTILLAVFALRQLPLWVSLSIFTYSLFLHAVLSIPWVILLSCYIGPGISISRGSK